VKASQLCDALIEVFRLGDRTEVATPGAGPLDPAIGAEHPLRVLVAEDNAVNRKLALALLSKMGYQADVATNGLEVLHAVEHASYDLILMDVQMPEMDGVEVT